MVLKKQDLPAENDLVMCTVTKVFAHGAFAEMVMGRMADEPDDHGDSQGERE